MALFLNLYLGHLLGDFIFQPGSLVLAKRRGAPGLLAHTAIIGVTCVAVLAGELAEYWPTVLVVMATHAAVELVTIYAYVGTRTRSLFTFILDQALHLLSIALIVWLAGAWVQDETAVTFGFEWPIVSLAVVTAVVTVAFLGSILAFETANTLMSRQGSKGEILRFDAKRVAGILERGIALAVGLWVGPLFLPLVFAPRAIATRRLPKGERRRPLIEIVAGLLLCMLILGLLHAANAASAYPLVP